MYKLLTFIFFSLISQLFSQSIYHFKNYTINEGLSQSTALCIHQDQNYGLWIGTQDGLNKFDGKNFDVFTPENTKGLNSNYFNAILTDKKGNLWFASENGLVVYNNFNESFTTFSPEKEIFGIKSFTFTVDETEIWIVDSRNEIWKFELNTKTFINQTKLFNTASPKDIYIGKNGQVYLSSEDKELEIYNLKNKQHHQISIPTKNGKKNNINFIKQFTNNELIIGTNQGLFEISLTTYKIKLKFPNLDKQYGILNISDVLLSKENTWYVTTSQQGLFTIFPNGNIINSIADNYQKNALINNNINAIFEDKNHTIWLATSRGISCFNPIIQGFLGITVSADLKHGLPSPNVWCITEDKTGNDIYIGTDIGISKFDRTKREFVHYPQNNINNIQENNSESTVLDIFYISDTRFLVAGDKSIQELTIHNQNFRYKSLSFISDDIYKRHHRIYKIIHYQDQEYLLASINGVLLIDLKNHKVQEFIHNPHKPQETILPGICRLIYKDSRNKIFFATSSGGLSILDDTYPNELKIIPYSKNTSLQQKYTTYITSICEIEKGVFIMGTNGDGAILWNEKTSKSIIYDKYKGLPNNVIYATIKDKQNNIWFSTNKGLARLNLKTNSITNFNELHGLLSNEFNTGAGFKSTTDKLFFGGISGLVFFEPEALSKYNLNLNIVLTKLKIDNKWVTPSNNNSPIHQSITYTDELVLNYKQNNFTLRFQTDNISNTELIQYKYTLEENNDEEHEIEVGNINELRFNSLSPGKYTLKIYAKVGFGEWISQPRILKITIQPPFWKTWWFISITLLCVILIIRYIIRKRIENEKREQIRLEYKIARRTAEIREQKIKIEKQNEILEKQSKQLEIEKEKSEKLLRNVIPDTMADELLEKGKTHARAYKVVSVMFTDIIGFTNIADTMDPTALVKRLDAKFKKFDEIIIKNNLERIKTIGDAYMAAGGVPVRNNTNPIDICLAGLQIQHFMKSIEKETIEQNEKPWKLRIGINTGEVTAGAVGTKRLAFDIWGSTVNYAQRAEMLGEAEKVTITHNTFLHIEPYFECTYKGQHSAKGGEKIKIYQVNRIKPELSINGEGIFPNERFHQIVELHHYSSINYYKAEKFIIKKLENELSNKLHYHCIEHTRDVVKAVERLALSENVTDEGLFLLKTAASYHDAGFVEQYEKNEPIGVRMASEILPKYGYSEEHIDIIKELILVTSVPHQPNNLLEEIICDADLDYLGRDDFHEIADRLRKELKEHGKINSDKKWDEIQVQFLTQHQYFTKTAQKTRNAKKAQNLQEIKDRLIRNEYID